MSTRLRRLAWILGLLIILLGAIMLRDKILELPAYQPREIVTEHEPENHISSSDALVTFPQERPQVYKNATFGVRVHLPERWEIVESGPFDNEKAFILFLDKYDKDSIHMGNFLMTMEPASDKPLPCTIPDLARRKQDKQLVKNSDGTAFLNGETEPIFGFASHQSGYVFGDAYSFCASYNGFFFYLRANDVYEFTSWDSFLTFVIGIEFFKPTQNMQRTEEVIIDAFCGLTIHKPATWKYWKNGACVDDSLLGYTSEDELRSPEGDSITISDAGENHEYPQERLLEKITISGFPAEKFKGAGDNWEFNFAEYDIVVHHPEKTYVFSLYLSDPTDTSRANEMTEIVKNIVIKP